ncbi:MAG TPA: hypothetical protein VNH44_07020 [Micropepsaceae bacterium]|nr:hypothetical protein [Micropepsaceae bacterium]
MSDRKFLFLVLCIAWVAMAAAIAVACYVTSTGWPLFAFALAPSSGTSKD